MGAEDLPDANAYNNDIPLTVYMVQASALTMTRLTCAQRDQWVRENIPSRVPVALDAPFGKESLSHSFSSAVAFRHILLLVCTKILDQSLIAASVPPHGLWRSTTSPVKKLSLKLFFLKHGYCILHDFGTCALPTLAWKFTLAMTMSAAPFARWNITQIMWWQCTLSWSLVS
jgi:hypothetical protein